MLELALVLPVLLMLVLGVMQFGTINNATVVLSQLSREGARYAASHANDTSGGTDPDTKIRAYIQTATTATSIDYNDLTITITPAIGSGSQRLAGNEIKVTLTYPMHKKLFIPNTFPGLSRLETYRTDCTMRIES